jgi:hypothetical protein
MQRPLGSIGYRYQTIGAEAFTTSIAVELIAAGTEHGAAPRAGMDFQEDVASILVVFDREALKERVAGGAGGGIELLSHESILCLSVRFVKHKNDT